MNIKSTTVERAFEALLHSLDLAYEWDGSFLHIRPRTRTMIDVDLLAASSQGGSGGNESGAGDADVWSKIDADLGTLVGDTGTLLVNSLAGTVTVEAPPSVVERVRGYLDRTVARVRSQVSLEARILEVRLDDEFRLGVNWQLLPGFFNADESGTLKGGAMVAQTAASGGTALNLGVLDAGNVSVFLDALQDQGQVRVLSSPRVSTMNNVPAMIRVVDQIPVIDREVIDSQGGLRTQFDIRFVEAGITIDVTPQIGEDGMITVRTTPSVTEQIGTVTTPDGFQTEPILSTRETSTSIRVRDGQTVVIGGLRTTRKTERVSGVPILSDLPLLGRCSAARSSRARRSS